MDPYGFSGFAVRHRAGHPRFHEILREMADLHDQKNHDYAAGGKPTGNFDRVSSLLTKYPGFPTATPYGVAIVYMLKQLDAALWLLSQKHESQTGEGVERRLRDVACYAILAELMYGERYETGQRPIRYNDMNGGYGAFPHVDSPKSSS